MIVSLWCYLKWPFCTIQCPNVWMVSSQLICRNWKTGILWLLYWEWLRLELYCWWPGVLYSQSNPSLLRTDKTVREERWEQRYIDMPLNTVALLSHLKTEASSAIPPVSCMTFCICMYACSPYNILAYLYIYFKSCNSTNHAFLWWLIKLHHKELEISEDAITKYHKINK